MQLLTTAYKNKPERSRKMTRKLKNIKQLAVDMYSEGTHPANFYAQTVI